MVEESRPWPGTVVGDAGPYTDDDWDDIWEALFGSGTTGSGREDKGVIRNFLNELEVTGVATPVQVDTGSALVHGKYYRNTTPVNVNVPIPTVAVRIDMIVLRSNWIAQTTRIYRIAGVEGGGEPALVQNDGVTWDIPLARLDVNLAGVITVTDRRVWLYQLMNNAPCARAYHDVNQAIPSGAWTPLAFNQERFDNDAIHDLVANNSRLTCQTPGKYQITGQVRFALSGAGTVRNIEIYLNGATSLAWATALPSGAASMNFTITTLYTLALGDFVQLRAFQDTGGNLNVDSQANYSPEFMMVRVSD